MSEKVKLLAVCENAFTTQDSGNLNLIGIFEVITADSFPAAHPKLSVVVSFHNLSEGSHNAKIHIVDEKTSTIVLGQIPELTFSASSHTWIANIVNITFPHPGSYMVKVFLDDQLVGEHQMLVETEG